MKTYVSIAPSLINQITETKDANSKANHQHQMMQPIPYPPPFHHPHIPVTHVPSLYKPPHFSSPPIHHQHQKLNLSNSNGNTTTTDNLKHHNHESRETNTSLRNESTSSNNGEKIPIPSANYYLNHVPQNAKMFNSQNNNNPEKENKEVFEKSREKENDNQARVQEPIQNSNQESGHDSGSNLGNPNNQTLTANQSQNLNNHGPNSNSMLNTNQVLNSNSMLNANPNSNSMLNANQIRFRLTNEKSR